MAPQRAAARHGAPLRSTPLRSTPHRFAPPHITSLCAATQRNVYRWLLLHDP